MIGADEVDAAIGRIHSADASIARRIALDATDGDERQALALIDAAELLADRLADTASFRQSVARVASALLERGRLAGAELAALTDPDLGDPDAPTTD